MGETSMVRSMSIVGKTTEQRLFTKKLPRMMQKALAIFLLRTSLHENLLLVGANYAKIEGNSMAGATYLYRLNKDANATFLTKLISPSFRVNGFFGTAVSLSDENAIIGSHYAAAPGINMVQVQHIYITLAKRPTKPHKTSIPLQFSPSPRICQLEPS